MIVIEPEGGLGNRLRVIHSAVKLSKAAGHSLLIRWIEKKGMMCHYHDLFEKTDLFSVDDVSRNIVNRGLQALMMGKINDVIRKMRFDLVLYNRDIQDHLQNNIDIAELVANRNKVFIKANQFFYEGKEGFYSPSPSGHITKRVEEIVAKFDENIIGIHIRGTDNRVSRKMSPLSLFIKKMESLLSHKPDSQFYLSADSEQTRKTVLDRFGREKILFQNEIELSRDAREGIEDAYVDMLCLSETKKIYGSYWSSFAAVAASIGGIEKETLMIEKKNV